MHPELTYQVSTAQIDELRRNANAFRSGLPTASRPAILLECAEG